MWPRAVAETVVWAAMYYSFPALLPVWESELGWSKMELSGAFTLALVVSASLAPVAGRLAMMAAERHVSTLAIFMGSYLAMGAAAGLLLGASLVPGLVVGFVIFQGAGYGVTSILRPVIIAELMGRRNFGVVAGLLATPFVGGYAISPTIAALVWEAGGYDLVLSIAILASALGLLALWTAWRSAAPGKPGAGARERVASDDGGRIEK